MSIPTLSTAPTAPARTQDNDTFVTNGDAFMAYIEGLGVELNAWAAALLPLVAAAFSTTSTTSVSIGTGTKNFTVGTGLSFIGGMQVLVSSDADPSTDYMIGTITSYNSGTGALAVSVGSGDAYGSGTHTDWSIAIAMTGAADYLALSGGTMTGLLTLVAAASGQESIVIPHGSAPSSPTNGSVWTTTGGVFARINGTTIQLASFAGTGTFTNKRVTPRINAQTTTTSPWAWNSDSYDQQSFSALANALTINADTGAPTDGQKAVFRFQDNGTTRTLTFTGGASKGFQDVSQTMTPSASNWTYATTANKILYVGCIYNGADSRWDIVAVQEEG